MSDVDFLSKEFISEESMFKFDHHGVSIDKKASYYEPYGSSSVIQSYFDGKNNEYKKLSQNVSQVNPAKLKLKTQKRFPAFFSVNKGELIEAIETKVLVFDERIQGLLDSKAYQCERSKKNKDIKAEDLELTYSELFQKTNITVPQIESSSPNSFYIDLSKNHTF